MMPGTTRALDRAESGIRDLLAPSPAPQLKGPDGEEWYQFEKADQSWTVVALLKLVRVVSGLRAAKRLGELGFTHEMAVLFRTVDDFLDETAFLVEGFEDGNPSKAAKKFITDFFGEDLLPIEKLRTDRKGPKRVSRAKIRAAGGRLLGSDNPDDPRRSAMAIDSVWDSYVHGGYPAVMELYGDNAGFHMNGMAGTVRVEQYRKHLSYYTYRLLAVAVTVAYAMGELSIGDGLREDAKTYARSSEYPDDSPEVTGLPEAST